MNSQLNSLQEARDLVANLSGPNFEGIIENDLDDIRDEADDYLEDLIRNSHLDEAISEALVNWMKDHEPDVLEKLIRQAGDKLFTELGGDEVED